MRIKTKISRLLREKTLLETLIDRIPEAMVQTNTDGIIERINEAFTNEFSYTREEAVGKNIDDLIVPPELKEEAINYTKRSAASETINTNTYRTGRDGKKIYVRLSVQPVLIDDKICAINALYHNISDKKKDDDTKSVIYNISAATLTMSEFSDIFDSIRHEIGKIWETRNFYIVLYNKDTETLTLSCFQDEKDHFEEVPVKDTITGWLIKENRPVLLKEADIDELERQGEVALVGTPCKVWLGVPFSLENEITGAMVLQDYNDENIFNQEDLRLLSLIGNQIALAIQRKRMLNNLILERRKAEDAAKLKQMFMSTMSHEIRTPLNEVIGINNLLLQGNPREDQMEYMKTLRFSANHLLTLVNDVLDYTKLESGNISFEKVNFNIFEFIEEMKRSYSFRIKNKGLDFDVKIDDSIPPVLIGDPVRLNQVLSNLLSNAIKFTDSGHIKLNARQVSRTGGQIKLKFSVSDTGIGIPPDRQKIIFESFKQATDDTTRKYGGSGLGLSISQKLVELQGGKLSVKSAPGKGSEFFFSMTFQVALSEENKDAMTREEEEKWDELEGKRVLIAEDNKINFFVVDKFLKKWGITVTHAENGKLAIDLASRNEYDLILMDLHMPVMDGIEATEIIRNSKEKGMKDLPVIALTAAIMSDHEEKVKHLDFNDFILKPFKPRDLYMKILKNAR